MESKREEPVGTETRYGWGSLSGTKIQKLNLGPGARQELFPDTG